MDIQRMDTVASVMGGMLLRGYRMLATSCDTCNNVLMQDKHGVKICVNCDRNAEEAPLTNGNGDKLDTEATPKELPASTVKLEEIKSVENEASGSRLCNVLSFNEKVLIEQMDQAAKSLHNHSYASVETKLLTVKFIRECAETITTLRKIGC